MKTEWVVELSVNRAKRLAGEGKIEEAYDILVGVTGQNDSTTLANLRGVWQAELLEVLRRRFANGAVYPRRTGSASDLKKAALRSKEFYVLDLFDGVTSVDDAMAISPLNELDTLRAVAKLVDAGLLKLDPMAVA